MLRSIDRFIFVPGLGAGVDHPAADLIDKGIHEATDGAVATEVVTTCDEFDTLYIAHSIERQAADLSRRIAREQGRVAIFAHSMGCLPAAMALASREFPQVDPANVVFAGTPLDSAHSLARLERILQLRPNREARETIEERLPKQVGDVHGVVSLPVTDSKKSKRYIVITRDYLASYPSSADHLTRLRKLSASTLLLSGKEKVTDCTVDNVQNFLPDRLIATDMNDTHANTIVIEGADHNLKGFCEKKVPQIVLQKIQDFGVDPSSIV